MCIAPNASTSLRGRRGESLTKAVTNAEGSSQQGKLNRAFSACVSLDMMPTLGRCPRPI
jgi:hypothetical protein